MRNRGIVLAAVALLLPAADFVACIVLQHRMADEYANWAKTLSSQGWSVHADSFEEDGFPTGAIVTMKGFSLSGGHAMLPGGLDWHADRVVLSLGLLHFWRLTVAPEGEQTLRVAGAKPVVFAADTLFATVPLGRGRADHIAIEADGLTAGLLQSRQKQDVRIDHLGLALTANRRGAARVTAQATIKASGIALPDKGRWPLGAQIRTASAVIDIASPALSGVAAADQARAWHDWGGSVTVRDLGLGWGPLDVQAQAKLGLDGSLQPEGEGTAKVTGWAQTVDALAAGGTIPGGMAETVKMVMGMMARAPENAGGSLSVPFTLKDSTLSVGKIPLIRLHDLNWGSV
jgi:hypothetical protein